MTSPSLSLSDLNDFAEHLISPTLSTLDGVAQVNIFGQKRFAVRVRVQPDALAARNISLDELTNALRSANANTPVGTLEGPSQTLTLQANRQLRNAAEFAELIVSSKGGNTVRLKEVAAVEDSFETVKTAAIVQRRDVDLAGDPAPARRQHGQGRRRGARQARRASSRSCRNRFACRPSTTARSRSAPRCTT